MAEPAGWAGEAGTSAGDVAGRPVTRLPPLKAGGCTRRSRLTPKASPKDFSSAGAIGAESACPDREKVWNPRLCARDFDLDEAGKSRAPSITTNAAAMPTGTSHGIGRRRRRTNSFGATVLK